MYQDIILEKKDNIAKIIFNRPKKLNALRNITKAELIDVFRKVQADETIKAVILTGTGASFCAGQDLKEGAEISTETEARDWGHLFMDGYDAIRALSKPLIASVRGNAVGAGCQYTLLCDITISDETGKFGMVEISAGLAGITATYLLWDTVGYKKTKELILTGDIIDAKEALRIGLINKVVPADELETATMELAKKLAEKAPTAIKSDKMWFNALTEADYAKAVLWVGNRHAEGYVKGEPRQAMEKFVKKE